MWVGLRPGSVGGTHTLNDKPFLLLVTVLVYQRATQSYIMFNNFALLKARQCKVTVQDIQDTFTNTIHEVPVTV